MQSGDVLPRLLLLETLRLEGRTQILLAVSHFYMNTQGTKHVYEGESNENLKSAIKNE